MTTIAEIIRDAYILAHVLNPQEEPPGELIARGFRILNQTISQWGGMGIYAPYYEPIITINLTQGTYTYATEQVVAQLMEANVVSSVDDTLTTIVLADDKQFNLFNYNIDNLQGRPVFLYLSNERYVDPDTGALGTKLYVYPPPDNNYSLNLTLKYVLPEYTSIQEVIFNLPPDYMKALIYHLAKDFISYHGTQLPQSFFEECDKLEQQLLAKNPTDMSVQNRNAFNQYGRFRPWGVGYVG